MWNIKPSQKTCVKVLVSSFKFYHYTLVSRIFPFTAHNSKFFFTYKFWKIHLAVVYLFIQVVGSVRSLCMLERCLAIRWVLYPQ